MDQYPEYDDLLDALAVDDEIDVSDFENIPGITAEKLKALHQRHIEARNRKSQ